MRVFIARFYHERKVKVLILTSSESKCLECGRIVVKLLNRYLTDGLLTQEIGENKKLSFFCIDLVYELLKQ